MIIHQETEHRRFSAQRVTPVTEHKLWFQETILRLIDLTEIDFCLTNALIF